MLCFFKSIFTTCKKRSPHGVRFWLIMTHMCPYDVNTRGGFQNKRACAPFYSGFLGKCPEPPGEMEKENGYSSLTCLGSAMSFKDRHRSPQPKAPTNSPQHGNPSPPRGPAFFFFNMEPRKPLISGRSFFGRGRYFDVFFSVIRVSSWLVVSL